MEGGGQEPKILFASNCMKCADLHTQKIIFLTPPCGVGVGGKESITKNNSVRKSMKYKDLHRQNHISNHPPMG